MEGSGGDDDDDGDGDHVMLNLPSSKVETMNEIGSGRSWEEKEEERRLEKEERERTRQLASEQVSTYKNLCVFPHLIGLSEHQAIKRQRLLESVARRQEEEILRRSAANNVPGCHHYHDHGDSDNDEDDEAM